MPNRILKESINESKGLSDVSQFAQDCFKRLITYADDYGRFNTDTEIMRARLYPRELEAVSTDDLLAGLTELVGVGKINLYAVSEARGEIFGYFPHWDEHQRIRNSRTKYPDPGENINDWALRRFVPIALKIRILLRDHFTCQICKKDFSLPQIPLRRAMRLLDGALHFDHIVPVQQGGRATEENLRLLCASCNLSRPKSFNPEELVADWDKLMPVAASRGESPQKAARARAESESNPIRIQSESNNRTPYGEFQNVLLSLEELKKLKERFGEEDCLQRVEKLSSYIASKGKKYKDHYATILTWANNDGGNGNNGNGHKPAGINRGYSQAIPGQKPAGAFDDIA